MSWILTDTNDRQFKCIFTPVKITNFILLDDLAQKMYCNFGNDIKSDEHFTAEIPYDKLNNAGGFSKINY
jgi:hypothetical protein